VERGGGVSRVKRKSAWGEADGILVMSCTQQKKFRIAFTKKIPPKRPTYKLCLERQQKESGEGFGGLAEWRQQYGWQQTNQLSEGGESKGGDIMGGGENHRPPDVSASWRKEVGGGIKDQRDITG